jgi:DNA-binding transcriptional LysR family regulator
VVGAAGDSVTPADLEAAPLYIDAPAIVCGTRHALAANRRVEWAAMVIEPWVLPPRSTRVRAAVEALFRRAGGMRPRVLAETLSLDLILELVANGAALAVLPQHLARRLAMAGQIRILDVETPGLVMPVSVFSRVGAAASQAIDTFRTCLVEAAALR